jgi:hypothetical protein
LLSSSMLFRSFMGIILLVLVPLGFEAKESVEEILYTGVGEDNKGLPLTLGCIGFGVMSVVVRSAGVSTSASVLELVFAVIM